MNDFPVQCPAIYDRILPGDTHPHHVRCTYIEGHEARHSFATLQVCDDAERATMTVAQAAAAPAELRGFIAEVEAGRLDEYLELILSAGHSRKLARRGVAGFGRARGGVIPPRSRVFG